jgi:hypothetical protein
MSNVTRLRVVSPPEAVTNQRVARKNSAHPFELKRKKSVFICGISVPQFPERAAPLRNGTQMNTEKH